MRQRTLEIHMMLLAIWCQMLAMRGKDSGRSPWRLVSAICVALAAAYIFLEP